MSSYVGNFGDSAEEQLRRRLEGVPLPDFRDMPTQSTDQENTSIKSGNVDTLVTRLRESTIEWLHEIDTRLEAAAEIDRLQQELAQQRQINANLINAARKEGIRAGDLQRELRRRREAAEGRG